MTPRFKRWSLAGALAVAVVVVVVLASAPYLPLVHGSDADEIGQLVEWLDIEAGTSVADLGAGDGRFAFALAERVGASGRVYATEVDDERLLEMRTRVKESDLEQVTIVEGESARTNLPDSCCDAIFSRNVYHHLSEPEAINADLQRALRSGGRLLIIDFEPGGPLDRVGAPDTAARHGGHGTPKSTVADEVTAAGFRMLRGPEPWRGRMYAILFEKPG